MFRLSLKDASINGDASTESDNKARTRSGHATLRDFFGEFAEGTFLREPAFVTAPYGTAWLKVGELALKVDLHTRQRKKEEAQNVKGEGVLAAAAKGLCARNNPNEIAKQRGGVPTPQNRPHKRSYGVCLSSL